MLFLSLGKIWANTAVGVCLIEESVTKDVKEHTCQENV